MLERMFDKGSMPALEAVVQFTSQRHKVIANNIANVDTVKYKAQDVVVRDFEKAMAKAFDKQRESTDGTWKIEKCGTVMPLAGGLDFKVKETDGAGILKHTENNVDLDVEMGKLVQNSGLHSLAMTLLGQQFSMIRSAINERAMG